jgi:hypothetical protein
VTLAELAAHFREPPPAGVPFTEYDRAYMAARTQLLAIFEADADFTLRARVERLRKALDDDPTDNHICPEDVVSMLDELLNPPKKEAP